MAINSVGVVTTGSQPGLRTDGWHQREFLEGYAPATAVADVLGQLRAAGWWTRDWPATWDPVPHTPSVPVTRTRGQVVTRVCPTSLTDVLALAVDQVRLPSSALEQMAQCRQFVAVDPAWGRCHQLTDTLAAAAVPPLPGPPSAPSTPSTPTPEEHR